MTSTSLQLVQSQSTKISNTCQVILTLLLLRVEQQLLQTVPCLCRYNETKHSNPVPAKGKEGSGDLHANPLKVRQIQVSKKHLQQHITSEDLYTSVMHRSTIQHCLPGLLDHAYESLTPPFQLRTIPSAPPHHTAVRWRCSVHVTLTCPWVLECCGRSREASQPQCRACGVRVQSSKFKVPVSPLVEYKVNSAHPLGL